MDTESRPYGPDEHKARARSLFAPGDTDRFGRPKTAGTGDVCALSPDNDPFYCGKPRDWQWARWFAGLWDEHGPAEGVRSHLRRFHYRLFTLNVPLADGRPYTADPALSWTHLCNASRYARYLGLVDPEALEDRRNPGLVALAPDPDPDGPDVQLGDDYVYGPELDDAALPDFGAALTEDAPAPMESSLMFPPVHVTGYATGTGEQPVLLEVWIEKSTMDDVLLPVCRALGVNVVRGQGFLSITSVCKLLRRAEESGRDCHVFYISDLDRSGEAMPLSVARQLEFWRDRLGVAVTVSLEPVALSAEQVECYALPSAPDSGSVELDAMEAVVPGELARLVGEAVAGWRDHGLDDRRLRARREAERNADAAWREQTGRIRQQLAPVFDRYAELAGRGGTVAGRFAAEAADIIAPLRDAVREANEAIGRLEERYRADVEQVNADVGELRRELVHGQAVAEAVSAEQAAAPRGCGGMVDAAFAGTDFGLPGEPQGAIDEARYDAAMLDSDRGWLDQLNRYREQKQLPLLQVSEGVGRPGRAPAPAVIPPPGPDRDALAAQLREGHWTRLEVAELLGVSNGAVGQMTERARRRNS